MESRQVTLREAPARRLERLARELGTTESALLEEALGMLFRARDSEKPDERDSSYQAPEASRRIRPEDTVFVVGTPLTANVAVSEGEPS
jgi:hypothetical protein